MSLERDPRLRLGMFARATIDADRSRGISVPRSAVLYRTEGPSVQVVRGNVIETRLVRVGYHSDIDIEIREGVRDGDLVVANAGSSLRDGDKVKPINADTLQWGCVDIGQDRRPRSAAGSSIVPIGCVAAIGESIPFGPGFSARLREFRMQKEAAARTNWIRPRGLFGKYVVAFLGLIVVVLVVNGALETWFTYRRQIELLAKAQLNKAEATARQIGESVSDFERQISFATRASATTIEQRRADYALLLQQVPSVERVIQLDNTGKEQLMAARGREAGGRKRHGLFEQSEVARRGDDRSGSPRSTFLVPTRSCPSPCPIPVETPARPLPRSTLGRCQG